MFVIGLGAKKKFKKKIILKYLGGKPYFCYRTLFCHFSFFFFCFVLVLVFGFWFPFFFFSFLWLFSLHVLIRMYVLTYLVYLSFPCLRPVWSRAILTVILR